MLVRLEAEEEAVALRGGGAAWHRSSPHHISVQWPPPCHGIPLADGNEADERAGGGSQSELRPTQGRAGGRRPAEERAQASTRGEQVGGKRLTGAASREAAAGRQTSTEVVTTDSCPDRVIIPDPTPKIWDWEETEGIGKRRRSGGDNGEEARNDTCCLRLSPDGIGRKAKTRVETCLAVRVVAIG
uniref:Uncharacterized protein n=1 Tax=Oryza rufipogon TaxID=4529 RepID=A0A0E0PC13_ORYRU